MKRAFAVSLSVLLGCVVVGQSNVPSLLLRAINNADRLRYTGTRVVSFRRGADSDQHTEYMIRDGSKLRVEFPAGSRFAGQIIVDNGVERRQYFPVENEIRILPPRIDDGSDRLKRLVLGPYSDQFRFVQNGKQVVAGYSTTVISILDGYGNTMQKLYIEPKSGAILKKVLLDRGGAPWGRFEFTKIDLTPRIDPSVFTLNRKGAKVITPMDAVRMAAAQGGFLVRTLPIETGYKLEFARVIKPRGESVLMQVFTSKGHRVSLFQLERSVDPDRLKKMGRGRDTVYSWQEDDRWYVLVGQTTQDELIRLARTLSDQP